MKYSLPILLLAALTLTTSGCGESSSDAAPAATATHRTEGASAVAQPATSEPIASPAPATAGAKQKFTLGVSIYAGWMPWYYAFENPEGESIVAKWAKRKGIEIDVKYYSDYISSVNAYVAKQDDACVMTNMEALDMPCVAGVDSSVVILGDYSFGNDALLVRDGLSLSGLKGQTITLVELSVSHYLLARALDSVGLQESDVTLLNTSDSTIGTAFIANKDQKAVVTWNPIVMQIEARPGVTKIFDSSKIPGEILDLCVVNTKTLNANPAFGEALAGIWFETLALIAKPGAPADAAIASMAKLSGCSAEEFKAQLRTTAMYWTAQEAVAQAKSEDLKSKMDSVRKFCFAHGLFGPDAQSVDAIGILYPDGSTQGSAQNVKLRWNTSFMEQAALEAAKLK
jgi:NitT/TauT family transport system substrate-binding protein